MVYICSNCISLYIPSSSGMSDSDSDSGSKSSSDSHSDKESKPKKKKTGGDSNFLKITGLPRKPG